MAGEEDVMWLAKVKPAASEHDHSVSGPVVARQRQEVCVWLSGMGAAPRSSP